jgi:AcrR family transcriptional regulator
MNKKLDILTKATPFFQKYGYRGVSFNDIIKVSGFSKGGFLHYYPSKEVLFAAVFIKLSSSLDLKSIKLFDEQSLVLCKQLIKWRFEFDNVLDDIEHKPLQLELTNFSNQLKNLHPDTAHTLGIFLINNSYTKSSNFKKYSTSNTKSTEKVEPKTRSLEEKAEDLVFVQDE